MSSPNEHLVVELLGESELSPLLAVIERLAGVGSYVWEFGRRVAWSAGMFRLLEVEPGQHVPGIDLFMSRVHEADRARVQEAYVRVLSGGNEVSVVYRIVLGDGKIRWIRGHALADTSAHPTPRIIGTLVDVTESQATANELAQVNAMLAETQRAAGVGSYVYDLTTGEQQWSDELKRILGLEALAQPSLELSAKLVHPEDRARQVAWGSAVAAGETMPPLLARIVRPDGTVRQFESRARRVEIEQGRPALLGATIDVTERVALEERLRHAATMDALGALASGVAHDFNNYLTIVEIQLGALQARIDDDPSALSAATEAVQQCAVLTRQLLAFARKQPTASRKLELATQLDAAVALFRRGAGADIDVRVEPPSEPVFVDVDAGQLNAALMNLAINARDAMPEGGTISFAVEVVELRANDPRLEVGWTPGSYARVRVRDTGTGIAAEHLPHIFDPYFSTKALGQGSGLGLASVYGTVRQHGGFVRVTSEHGSGATFDVYLPRAPGGTPASAPEPTPVRARPQMSGCVLVAEDLAALRTVLTKLLQAEGLEVLAAADGAEALELYETHRVDVVLTDFSMPRLDGLELAQRAIGKDPRVGIVLMTGYADTAAMRELPSWAHLIKKPFGPDEVLAAVGEALARRRTER